jgi:hypothetical protein
MLPDKSNPLWRDVAIVALRGAQEKSPLVTAAAHTRNGSVTPCRTQRAKMNLSSLSEGAGKGCACPMPTAAT